METFDQYDQNPAFTEYRSSIRREHQENMKSKYNEAINQHMKSLGTQFYFLEIKPI